jgi:hypothetical protein
MTERINGASYPGIWVERNTGFVKVVFSLNIKAITAADLSVIGTPTAANPTNAVAAGTIADSTFGVTESALSYALRDLETRATVLGVSTYNATTFAVDVFLGHAEGWFSALNDGIVIAPPLTPVIQLKGAKAVVTTAGTAGAGTTVVPVGGIVSVDHASFPGITYTVRYVAFDGTMPIPVAPGQLILGPGGTSGATPPGSPTGTPGWYPGTAPHQS